MLQEVDDMASVVIQEPPTDPSQLAVFAKKVQTTIRRCMVFIGDTSPSRFRICLISITTFYIFRVFRVSCTPPPGIAGSCTPHQPILHASSFDEEEQTDDMDGVQHYGFGHRIGKKTTRFTPSDWP
ncbi:hypothetical protein M9H77_34041 [Catharanthus roseus]|uniref:Uncharacterized protein n=1 Tax=Catharanthus roseus TaxID=4058 RepID=A0ACB9ZK10_CATRO|nr:hypothetical protein M9H77_34041 [Catharanthus roseus]